MPDATPRKPDAIRCPRDYPPPGTYAGVPTRDRDIARNLLFGPVLGSKRVGSSQLLDSNESFIIPMPAPKYHVTRYYPYGHPNEKQDRYEWFIAGTTKDGTLVPTAPEIGHPGEERRVKLGYLKPDPHASDASVQQAVDAAYDERVAQHIRSPEHLAKLRELGIVLGGTDPTATGEESDGTAG